mgnify:CR=1 FL=1
MNLYSIIYKQIVYYRVGLIMPVIRVNEKSSLTELPLSRDYADARPSSVTIGDLHGNTLKLIHFLLREGIIGFESSNSEENKQAYEELVSLYTEMENFFRDTSGEQVLDAKNQPINISKPPARGVEGLKNTDYIGLKVAKDRRPTLSILDKHVIKFEQSEDHKQKYQELDRRFNEFMQKLKVNDSKTLVRFIGDGFADRGVNDKWTLDVLKFLKNNEVPTTTLLSNHDLDFISYYESQPERMIIGPDQRPSLAAIEYLRNSKILTTGDLTELIDSAYKPTLKLIDYTFTDTGIRLFTHAPVSFEAIQDIAKYLKITYKDDTKEDLARTIDQINKKIQQHVADKTLHKLWKDADTQKESKIEPFLYFLWNRFNVNKIDVLNLRPNTFNGYTISYVHGHDSTPSELNHVINLDNEHGKFNTPEYNNKKDYLVLPLNEPSKLQATYQATSPARTGAITGGIATLGAGAITGALIALTALSVIAPPLGLGLITLIGAAIGISIGVGFIVGAIAAKYQANKNKDHVPPITVTDRSNDAAIPEAPSALKQLTDGSPNHLKVQEESDIVIPSEAESLQIKQADPSSQAPQDEDDDEDIIATADPNESYTTPKKT